MNLQLIDNVQSVTNQTPGYSPKVDQAEQMYTKIEDSLTFKYTTNLQNTAVSVSTSNASSWLTTL